MNVVMLARTPLAASPIEMMKCINRYNKEGINVNLVSIRDRYADGKVYPSDYVWGNNKRVCETIINSADIIHIHNEMPIEMKYLIDNKKKIVQFHSCPKRRGYAELYKYGNYKYCIDQPMQREVYEDLEGLPNLIDPYEYIPLKKINLKNRKLHIVFAPTNNWPKDKIGSKASDYVIECLKKLDTDKVRLSIFSNKSYLENLTIKSTADIIIDDIVNNTYHRTSLEACCFGVALLTSSKDIGCLYTNIDNLEDNLNLLINNINMLEDIKDKSRNWIVDAWDIRKQVKKYVEVYKMII
jgi:hypothetical protein